MTPKEKKRSFPSLYQAKFYKEGTGKTLKKRLEL